MDVPYTAYEMDEAGEHGRAIQGKLLETTGQRTVPNVFINGKHIGGYDATAALQQNGKLQQLLNEERGEL